MAKTNTRTNAPKTKTEVDLNSKKAAKKTAPIPGRAPAARDDVPHALKTETAVGEGVKFPTAKTEGVKATEFKLRPGQIVVTEEHGLVRVIWVATIETKMVARDVRGVERMIEARATKATREQVDAYRAALKFLSKSANQRPFKVNDVVAHLEDPLTPIALVVSIQDDRHELRLGVLDDQNEYRTSVLVGPYLQKGLVLVEPKIGAAWLKDIEKNREKVIRAAAKAESKADTLRKEEQKKAEKAKREAERQDDTVTETSPRFETIPVLAAFVFRGFTWVKTSKSNAVRVPVRGPISAPVASLVSDTQTVKVEPQRFKKAQQVHAYTESRV